MEAARRWYKIGVLGGAAALLVLAFALVSGAQASGSYVECGSKKITIQIGGIAKENVTSPIRAPFTRYVGAGDPAELNEEVHGHGTRHAIGELITCPFCLAQWLATSFAFGFIFAPTVTRLVASTMAVVAAADFLQLGYTWMQHKAEAG